jgi:hypothetical protein
VVAWKYELLLKLYQQRRVSLMDVAAWLIVWAFSPTGLDIVMASPIRAADPFFATVLQHGMFLSHVCFLYIIHRSSSSLHPSQSQTETKTVPFTGRVFTWDRDAFMAAMELPQTRELVRKRRKRRS